MVDNFRSRSRLGLSWAGRAGAALALTIGLTSLGFAQAPEKPSNPPPKNDQDVSPPQVPGKPLVGAATDANLVESAIADGTAWLIAQQEKDGGWNLGGNLEGARSAATGLALLSLLGSGQTPNAGAYKEKVAAGVKFLQGRGRESENGKAMLEPGGSMYGHGIATWALCEAYAVTGDKESKAVAEQAVKYLIFAQDPTGGGWRYAARQPGDMSVTGWQLSALNAARLAGLDVPTETLTGASRFLDQLETAQKDGYGYTTPGVGKATTAEGLLGRMYLGTKSDDPKMAPAFATLIKFGPSKNNAYFRFFGTQAMLHHGGEPWQTWNGEVRHLLVESQEKADGKNRGSWFFSDDQFGANVGRLYQTSLAVLTLDVYYRHLAVFRAK